MSDELREQILSISRDIGKKNREEARARGREFEDKIIKLCDDIGIIARKTSNSGAKRNDGDASTLTLQMEMKSTGRKSPSINAKVFEKIKRQAAYHNRVPVLLIENKDGTAFAVLDAETFFRRYVSNEEQVEYGQDPAI